MKAKNILKTLALPVAVALGMMATSCSSDDNIVNEQQAGAAKHEIPVTVSATRSGDEGTRATFNGTSRKLEFEDGDQLFIQGTHATAGTFAGVLSNTSAATGTFSGTVTTQNEYTGTSEALFASATATLLPKGYGTIGYLTLSDEGASQTLTVDATKAFVTASSADAAKALAIEQLSLEQATTYSSGFALAPVNAVLNYSISGLANSTAYTPSVSDATTAISGSVTSDASGNAYFAVAFAPAGSKTYTLSITGFSNIAVANRTLTAGKVYNKTATAAASAPEGAISGQFTINSSGDKVYFSKGNLQAKIANYNSTTKVATASEWKFADSQYSYIGNAAGNTTFATDTWVDLFSWVGNSASNNTYGLITFDSSSQANHGNVADESLKTDWGTAAASSIGEGWRTLTSAEWTYLFNTRTVNNGTGSGKSYTWGKSVNGVLGVVLYPDDYTGAEYSGSDWSDFESAGCVFLPAAGRRNGTSVYSVGTYGGYWSSTAHGTGIAYDVYFYSDSVDPAKDYERVYGFSVRLVRDAN